jgi:gas vesicle protein
MEKTNFKRRNFLLGLGLGGVGAAAALLAGKSAAAPEAETAVVETPQAGKGYRLSEHVQTYYRKARI